MRKMRKRLEGKKTGGEREYKELGAGKYAGLRARWEMLQAKQDEKERMKMRVAAAAGSWMRTR